MREPPRLAPDTLTTTVAAHYALSVATLTFLPIGNDSATSVYRLEAADGAAYFLKLRTRAGFSAPSLHLPRFLQAQGVPHLLAPLPTKTQALSVDVGDFVLSLYPLLEARTAVEAGFSEEQWRALGAVMGQIHTQPLTPEIDSLLPRETFIPSRRGVLRDLEAALHHPAPANAEQRDLAEFWRAHQPEIRRVLDRADSLGSQLRLRARPQVVCHADLHTWNVLVDAAGEFWLVDWDEVILAPKERDLMFVIGGIGRGLVSAAETARFLEGYGEAAVEATALTYYRYAWAAQDMGAYAEQAIFTPEVSDEARREAVAGFKSLFEPGNIVALAVESDDAH